MLFCKSLLTVDSVMWIVVENERGRDVLSSNRDVRLRFLASLDNLIFATCQLCSPKGLRSHSKWFVTSKNKKKKKKRKVNGHGPEEDEEVRNRKEILVKS